MVRVAVLVSGGGTNLQAIIDAQANGIIKSGTIALVLSSKENVYALDRAKNANIATETCVRKMYATKEAYDEALLVILKRYNIEVIVLAGFLCILGKQLIAEYSNKIINVHPSLIPSFCGEGYYGIAVHEAALAKGVKVTGATVHLVNEVPDGGKILLQRAVEVREGDTAEALQKRVMEEAEWLLLPRAVEMLCSKGDNL